MSGPGPDAPGADFGVCGPQSGPSVPARADFCDAVRFCPRTIVSFSSPPFFLSCGRTPCCGCLRQPIRWLWCLMRVSACLVSPRQACQPRLASLLQVNGGLPVDHQEYIKKQLSTRTLRSASSAQGPLQSLYYGCVPGLRVGPLPPEELSNWRGLCLKRVCTPAHYRAVSDAQNRSLTPIMMSNGFYSQNGRWPDPESSRQKGGDGYFPNYSIFCILLV